MSWLRRRLLKWVLNKAIHDFYYAQVELLDATEIEEKAYCQGVCDGITQVIDYIDQASVPKEASPAYELVMYNDEECTCNVCSPEQTVKQLQHI